MKMRTLLPSLALAALMTAGPAVTAAPRPTSSQDAEDRPIYEATLKAFLGPNLPAVLVVQTMPLLGATPSASDWEWFGPGTEALRASVETAPPLTIAAFTAEAFPAGTQLVPRQTIAEVLRTAPAGADIEDRWIPFRARFKSQTFQAFSRPVRSADGLNALLRYSHTCGSLCAESGYAWLRRTSTSVPWTVVKRKIKIVS